MRFLPRAGTLPKGRRESPTRRDERRPLRLLARREVTGGALLIAGTTSGCRQVDGRRRAVPAVGAQGNSGRTVQGAEHVATTRWSPSTAARSAAPRAMQARAAGLAPSTRFNPVLLKPGSDRTSQLVVRGRPVGTVSAADYIEHRDALAGVVADELASTASRIRRRDVRGRRITRRDQPARNRSRQHGTGARCEPARRGGRRHRPRRPARPPVRHRRGALRRRTRR